MKFTGETISQSRAWSADLCTRLERSARLLDFWDAAVEDSRKRAAWRVPERWGCTREILWKRRNEALEYFMNQDLNSNN